MFRLLAAAACVVLFASQSSQAGTISNVKSIKITNTRVDWFYIEELEILNADGTDVASTAFGATATATDGPSFGSTIEGGINDVFANCCGNGWHSGNADGNQMYTITLPSPQTITGDVTVWNRQDGCCANRLDGMLFEFFDGDDGAGTLLASQQVDNLAADSGGGISSATGASFPLPDAEIPEPTTLILSAIAGLLALATRTRRRHGRR